MGIHRHQGAILAFHGLLGDALQVEVDGEAKIVAGDGELLAELPDLLARLLTMTSREPSVPRRIAS